MFPTMALTIACRQWNQFLQSASPVEKDSTKVKLTKYHSQTALHLFDLKNLTFANFYRMSCVCVDCMITESRARPAYCFEGCYFHEMTAHQTRSQWIFLAKLSSLAAWNSETLALVNLLTSKFSLLLIVCHLLEISCFQFWAPIMRRNMRSWDCFQSFVCVGGGKVLLLIKRKSHRFELTL